LLDQVIHHGKRDYALLVQERSGHVLNAARRLAVIPKGFHEPLTDLRADAHLGATLRREMEEELFGRDDIDSTVAGNCAAVPLHPSRMSEPMQWLAQKPGRLRMECTGFGLNLISDLVTQEDWSNEGLFAFLQGVRCLREIDPERVDLPEIHLMTATASGP
jgi:hypothetical protein